MKDEQKIRAAAIKEARLRLLPINVHSWNEPAVSRQREHQAAIRALKAILSEARLALSKTQGLWWMLDFDIESSLSSIEHVLKTIIPALEQTRLAVEKGRGRGQPAKSLRDQIIAETATAIRQRYRRLTREVTCSVIAEALRKNGNNLSEKRVKTIWEGKGPKGPQVINTWD
jgi:hypothetical protein